MIIIITIYVQQKVELKQSRKDIDSNAGRNVYRSNGCKGLYYYARVELVLGGLV